MLFDLPNDDLLYDALLARSFDYEGQAFVCVKSTGIFCRLSCPARKPKRENTLFFDSIAACLNSGFRPCERCRPLDGASEKEPLVDGLLKLLDRHPDHRWTEDDLVRRGLDPSTVRRAFKRSLGVTFLDLARQRRMGEAARQLSAGARVIEAQIDAGYDSPSGFRAAFAKLMGEAPATAQGRELLFADWIETPLGPMVAVADQTHLHLLEFHDRKALPAEMESLKRKTRSAVVPGRTPPIDQIDAELKTYFAGNSGDFRTPMALDGSAFERQVWTKLSQIPLGETRSYSDIARETGTIQAVRAVARANGSNCIAIVVPCHRCIGADGSLTGYGGGLWRKQWLLRHEAKMRPVGLFGAG
ncbi:trifunctional transcriptional activator/DNA repair protein Ada/methylated-DNA--[protein]-cysteine S-methyltransferase [Sinorhizobium numidicum]|uniref:Trifunctional transcriptional activator/DNA repair protein Ada/methylated-DNA--[protein]-cysteine S-methyltransferase n=1 Tax=Sinorhizobium numidicum TaxID=680248 RepID=A0ABY8D0R7_9HYPH|nr:trifunctional transcriptional activator/DNA repair protein Ada/methylated-DNA--[protein]-cysteine S-methyltransferase [Sinorhizobium numidicum]WEX77820.1 trifunctional transcriptional activator/DNA repair protein Ada/methylated-DNA--[protein]-cysteine S-methyltransferase [Sinorhizobium numidicum]WEX84479.1 trifunctional transcriptional activator/DNA repair protein Ada/methylated-DNA--[protein]-cysteine S-methyltransferase [Sinorhizobium numidicum]